MPESPRSRRLFIALLTLLLLLALDAARSLIGHFGYPTPVSIWHPNPEVYVDMNWPPSANVPANASHAQRLYLEKCAFCHGPDGRGNGASAPSMIPRPRDFTQGLFKYKSTPAAAPPTDDDLIKVVTDGLHASGMPYFRGILSAADIRDAVGYVKGFSKVFAAGTAAPIEVPPRVPATAESIARGEALYTQSGCATCHGADLRGGQWMQDSKGYPVISRDLTAPWTFRGGDSPEDVFLRLSTGLAPAPMPAFAELLADSRWDLVNFLESRRRTPPWQPGGVLAGPGQTRDLETRGRYLVHAEMCGLCHTEIDPAMIYRDDHYLAGGMRVGGYPHGTFITRNLTSDRETGLGRWSEAEIATAIRDGRAKGGRLLNFWGMPWPWLHNLSPGDALAIAHYLKTLPPVHNAIPAPLRYGVIETIAAKLSHRNPLLGWPVLTYAVGSYANMPPPSMASIANTLKDAQWIVLIVGLIILAVVSRRSLPRTAGGWMRLTALAAAGLVVFGAGVFLYEAPTVSVIPPDRMADGATGSIPWPDVSKLSPTDANLVRRGRYIFANASCAYCHNNDGSGGLKLSGPFGTLFTPNISPDRAAGLGTWTDAEIARAVRSGISRDGRSLFWQGMPWDHFSNLDEEDVVAVIAYLRAIPPVGEKVPPYRPPAPDDCKVYTFWTYRNLEPGCR